MKNSIFLIKTSNDKVVPALCIDTAYNGNFILAQLRKANDVDIFNTKSRREMEKINRSKPEREQLTIREKYEIDTVYLGQPKGLLSNSVVMVRKLHEVERTNLIKKISEVNDELVLKCKQLIKKLNKIAMLQDELHKLKKRVLLASINNERYTDYEIRISEILKEIGYRNKKKKNKMPYRNFREVPNKGYIKIYLGGR